MHLTGKTVEGGLTGRAVDAAVIFMLEPQGKGLVDFRQGCSLESWQKSGSDSLKKPLDFTFPLGV
jgi:hypothetical protein